MSATEQAATRQRIIEAAKSEFASRGLSGARFDEISLAAGYAKGTIYNYFPDKNALFFTIVEQWCHQLVDSFLPDPGRGAAGDLLEIARLDVEIARKDPELAALVINQVPGSAMEHRAALFDALEPAIQLLAEVIADGQATGELDDTRSAVTMARLFLAVLSAIEQEALDPLCDLTLDDVLPLAQRTGLAAFRP